MGSLQSKDERIYPTTSKAIKLSHDMNTIDYTAVDEYEKSIAGINKKVLGISFLVALSFLVLLLLLSGSNTLEKFFDTIGPFSLLSLFPLVITFLVLQNTIQKNYR